MRSEVRQSKGFVFLAVLGVMAVTILLAFAMSGTTQHSYYATGLSLVAVQEDLMTQSAADYALLLLAEKKMKADGLPQPFTIVSDHLRGRKVTGNVTVVAVTEETIYKWLNVAYQPGDIWIHVVSPQMKLEQGVGERWLLSNREGRRPRPIDMSSVSVFKGILPR